jgi:hypothetical protein
MSATPQSRPAAPDPAFDQTDPAMARRLERLGLAHHEEQWTERYLLCQHLADPALATPREEFEATSRFIRDLVAHRWVSTRQAREHAAAKRIHYFSMEYLESEGFAGLLRLSRGQNPGAGGRGPGPLPFLPLASHRGAYRLER